MGKEDSASSSATTDTSSVTAIKVKVVLDTTTEELKNQFKGVQNSFKKTPVEIAFGINEGATIGNVNAALKRIIKKVESPKLTLKIDESNIDAAIQKASKKAQNGASKGSGTNQLDSAFQKFSTDLMKSDIPKFFVDLATVFVDGADNAVKFAGTLPTLTAAISGVLSVMQMSGKLKNGAGKVNMPSYICCV